MHIRYLNTSLTAIIIISAAIILPLYIVYIDCML